MNRSAGLQPGALSDRSFAPRRGSALRSAELRPGAFRLPNCRVGDRRSAGFKFAPGVIKKVGEQEPDKTPVEWYSVDDDRVEARNGAHAIPARSGLDG